MNAKTFHTIYRSNLESVQAELQKPGLLEDKIKLLQELCDVLDTIATSARLQCDGTRSSIKSMFTKVPQVATEAKTLADAWQRDVTKALCNRQTKG